MVAVRRQKTLIPVLLAHSPLLLALGLWQRQGLRDSLALALVPLATGTFARVTASTRWPPLVSIVGLACCSLTLVPLGGPVATLHALAVLAVVALQLDWTGTATEAGHARSAALAVQLDRVAHQADRRRAQADLLVSLARRNQALLQRQLDLIDELERDEQDPDVLASLYRLDHYATRIRRNAESLLVLSGNAPDRRRLEPSLVSEVVRGAVAEIDEYTRIDVVTVEDPLVAGRAVPDLAHLLAELIENAAQLSPADSRVVVAGHFDADHYVLRVKDRGVGMTEQLLDERNALLTDPPEVDLDAARTLGLHVVARLSRRLGLALRLERNAGGGITAVVSLPTALLVGPADGGPRRPSALALGDLGDDTWQPHPIESITAPAPVLAAVAEAAVRSPLARRVPRASLPAALQQRLADGDESLTSLDRPAEARSRLARFQSGVRDGRSASTGGTR